MIGQHLLDLNDKIIDYLRNKYNADAFGNTATHEFQIFELTSTSTASTYQGNGNPMDTDNILFIYAPKTLDPYIRSHLVNGKIDRTPFFRDLFVHNHAVFYGNYYLLSQMVYVLKSDDINASGYDLHSFFNIVNTVMLQKNWGLALPSGVNTTPLAPDLAEIASTPKVSSCDCGARKTYGITDDQEGHAGWCQTQQNKHGVI